MSKSNLGPKIDLKSDQNRSKMKLKIEQKETSKLRSIFDRFLEAPGGREQHWQGRKGPKRRGGDPPLKLITKVISDTIMSILAN